MAKGWRRNALLPREVEYEVDETGRMHDTGNWRMAWPGIIAGIPEDIEATKDIDVTKGLTDEQLGSVLNLAGMATFPIKGSGPIDASSFGVGGGINARNAPMGLLKEALNAEKKPGIFRKGVSLTHTWPKYGWERLPTGDPMFEIPSADIKFTEAFNALPEGEANAIPMRDAVEFAELYGNYPQIGTDYGAFKLPENSPNAGEFNPGSSLVGIKPTGEDPLGTATHEIQHLVQNQEGWEPGSNPSLGYHGAVDYGEGTYVHEAAMKIAMDTLWKAGIEPTPELISRMFQDPNVYSDIGKVASLHGYENTIGEVQARNASFRRNLPPEFLKLKPPSSTASVPYSSQLTREELTKPVGWLSTDFIPLDPNLHGPNRIVEDRLRKLGITLNSLGYPR